MINNVVLIGHLTRDPELRYTPSNVAVATFNLAVNRNLKAQTESERQTSLIVLCGVSKLKISQIGLKRVLLWESLAASRLVAMTISKVNVSM